jgi:hypothetical protein
MPLFNFQKQFAADVESRKKRQTIRAKRKNRPKVGQTAYLYTGARTKACTKLGEATIKAVYSIRISRIGIRAEGFCDAIKPVEEMARDDGFENFEAMLDWFYKTHGLPFEGDLIQW